MRNDWATVPLGEVLRKSEEWIAIEPNTKYKEVTVRLWGKGVVQRRLAEGSEIAASWRNVVRANQFILSRIDARQGALGLIPSSLDGAVVSTDFPVFSLNEAKILPAFLNWLSKTQSFIDICKAASVGTTNRIRLKEEEFLAMKLSLPSLTEQQRIVAHIEELAAKIAEARELRQAATHETDKIIERELALIVDALSKDCGLTSLDNLIINAGYGTSVKCDSLRKNEHLPVLRIPNIASEQINFNDLKYGGVPEAEAKRVLLKEGDILIVRTNGSAELIGRCAVISHLPEPTAFASYLIRIACDQALVKPNFLQMMLKHLRTDGQLFDLARTTAGQYNVSLGRLRAARLPVPPLSEQMRVLSHMDTIQLKVNSLRQLQSQTAAELDAMLPSVLDKAFKGEL